MFLGTGLRLCYRVLLLGCLLWARWGRMMMGDGLGLWRCGLGDVARGCGSLGGFCGLLGRWRSSGWVGR